MRAALRILCVTSSLLSVAQFARGEILSASLGIQLVAPPTSVEPGATISAANGIAFDEQQGVTLSATDVDYDISGVPAIYDAAAEFNGSFIPVGLTVNSHFVHIDTGGGQMLISSFIDFQNRILGVAVLNSSLNSGDGVLGATTTAYPTNTAPTRGLELSGAQGLVHVRNSARSIFVSVAASDLEQLRVITLATDIDGDYNGDGDVGIADLSIWERYFGRDDMLAADGNANFIVDGGDFLEWQRNATLTAPPVAAIPEPRALPLGVASLVLLVAASPRDARRASPRLA